MPSTDLETLSDLLGDFLSIYHDSLAGSEKKILADARFIVERVIEVADHA